MKNVLCCEWFFHHIDERVDATAGFRSLSCSAPRLWNPLSHWHLKSLKKNIYRETFPSKTATILLNCFLSAYREFAVYNLSIHPSIPFSSSTFKMVFPLWDCGEDAGRYPSCLWGRGRVTCSSQGCIERKTVTFTPKDNPGMTVFGLQEGHRFIQVWLFLITLRALKDPYK